MTGWPLDFVVAPSSYQVHWHTSDGSSMPFDMFFACNFLFFVVSGTSGREVNDAQHTDRAGL